MNKFILLIVLVFASFTSFSQENKTSSNSVFSFISPEAVIHYYIKIWAERDYESYSKIIAHDDDIVFIGTDSNEYVKGWKNLDSIFKKQAGVYKPFKISIKDMNINMSKSKDVAWFSIIVDVVIPNKKPIYYSGLRITGVIEKRENGWVLVQIHNSMCILKRCLTNNKE